MNRKASAQLTTDQELKDGRIAFSPVVTVRQALGFWAYPINRAEKRYTRRDKRM